MAHRELIDPIKHRLLSGVREGKVGGGGVDIQVYRYTGYNTGMVGGAIRWRMAAVGYEPTTQPDTNKGSYLGHAIVNWVRW